jgi:hypothetical protein
MPRLQLPQLLRHPLVLGLQYFNQMF